MAPYNLLKNIYIYVCAIYIVTSTDLSNCGSNYNFNGLSGEIQFPYFGGQYSNNVECRWLINVGPNILYVDFNYIDMECGYDYVAFYDDPTYQNQISKYCSNNYVTTVRHSGVLYIKVVTDGTRVKSGFKLTWNNVAKDPCYYKNCYSQNYCTRVSGKEVCSCPLGYRLLSDGSSCLLDPCSQSYCHSSSYCNVVFGTAVCSCHEGYYFRQDGKCYPYVNGTQYGTFNVQLSGSSIVLIAFGIIFCLFLFGFFTICCKRRKSKLEPVTVQFYSETQGAVVQGRSQNQMQTDVQIGLNNLAHSNTYLPSNEIGLDNTAHFEVAPPPYEPIPQSISVSVILSNESPPEYSN